MKQFYTSEEKRGLVYFVLFLSMIGIIILAAVIVDGCTTPVDVGTLVDQSADYENARRATVSAWEEIIGRVSDECYQRSIDAMVVETGRFPESCMPPLELGQYIGCYMPTGVLDETSEYYGFDGDIIFIYEGRTPLQKADTAVHEFGHLLHFCENNGDAFLLGDPDRFLDTLAECAAIILAGENPPSRCAELPGDYFHLDSRVWDRIKVSENGYGTNTVEAVGCANVVL